MTTRTAALIAAMALLGTVSPAAFAQNTSVNTDDDIVKQVNKIDQDQTAVNFASAGGSSDGKEHDGDGKEHDGDGKEHDGDGKEHDKEKFKDGGDIIAGNNAAAVSFQDQDATATNDNDDNDDFTTTQVDVCALVLVAIIC
jgi:hypothetical protein